MSRAGVRKDLSLAQNSPQNVYLSFLDPFFMPFSAHFLTPSPLLGSSKPPRNPLEKCLIHLLNNLTDYFILLSVTHLPRIWGRVLELLPRLLE